MKQLSVYYNDEMNKEATVFFVTRQEFRVVVKSDSGTHYSTTFETEESAENFAESWVIEK